MEQQTTKRARVPHYDDPVAVGRRISEARVAAGLSQRDLAFPGCTAAYISRLEHGERIPSLQVMRQIALRTGTSESFLAFGKEAIDPSVAERVRAVERAEQDGQPEEIARCYRALASAASKAAKALKT